MRTYEKVLLIAGLVVVGVTLAYRNLLDEEQKKDLREAADAVRAANDEVIDSVSPLRIAESKSGLSYKAILFTGTADFTIGPDNARRHREALRAAGIKRVKVVTYKNVTHSIGASYAAEDMFSKSLRLFAKNL